MRKLSFDILFKLLTAIPLLLVVAPVAHAADPLSSMEEQGAAIDRDEQSGKVTFIGKGREQPVNGLNNILGYSATTNDEKNASTLLQTFGHSFGLSNPKAQMQVMRKDMGKDMGLVHYQQMHGGIPVIGGELVVSMVKHKFNSMNGEVSQNLPQLTTPGISTDVAIATAKLLVQQQYGLYDPQNPLETTTPELQIYDPKLLDTGDKNGPTRLVWRIEISPANGPSDIHEIVFVDAQTGSIALNFNQTGEIKNRVTKALSNGTLYTYCVETTNCMSDNAFFQDVVYAHRYAGDTYDFYANYLGRDSYDNKGSAIISNTHIPAAGAAAWLPTSQEMVYADGFSRADDVVGHEITHGVSQASALEFAGMYVGQTGAINESFSDIFGEFVDLTNGYGRDIPEFNWLIGEDLPITNINPRGAVRNMANPPDYGRQPDKMTSPYYNLLGNVYIGSNQQPSQDNDQGGVHINSGVGNKAAFLMTSGGTFNGVAVPGLGIPKVARIYYQAYRYLTAGTQYSNLFRILQQSCSDLTSIQVTTLADCNSVYRAVVAVEMYKPPIR
jgi:bacillolysin